MFANLSSYKIRILQAVGLLILGFLGFSIADLCSKILQEDYRIYQILFISGSFGMVVSGTLLFLRHGWKAFFPPNVFLHILRGGVTLGTAFCMVSALRTLPLADFYGVVFLSPFIMLILTVLFLSEKVGWRRWSAVAIAFTGVLILAGPQFNTFGEGFVYAMLGALCSATSVILLRKIGHGAPLLLYGFYPSLFIALFNGAAMIATDSALPLTGDHTVYFFFHGPAAMMGVICTSLGYARSPEASIVAPFMYTQIIWGILFGWLFFAAVLTPTTVAGLALIIGAGCYSIWRDYHRAHDDTKLTPDNT